MATESFPDKLREEVAAAAESTPAELGEELKLLRELVAKQQQQIDKMSDEIASLRVATTHTDQFRVAQYNILAGYLGDNRQPWFMYGIPITEERGRRSSPNSTRRARTASTRTPAGQSTSSTF